MTLKEIMKDFLFEGVSNDDINDAIDNHKYVVITYEGTNGSHNLKRMIQPVAFGCTSAGFPVIRAFERFGDTKTTVPNWKYLRVDRISSWHETNKTFDEPADLFNPNGDKTMTVVYNIAKFGDNDSNLSSVSTDSPKTNVYYTDTERKLAKLQKQLKNPLTLSDMKAQDAFNSIEHNVPQTSGPKTVDDMKKGTDSVYSDEYNYNVFDNALSAAGKNAKRNGHYYFQNRENGKFAKGNILDEPQEDDSGLADEYLNNNKKIETIEDLRNVLGDTSKPITLQDLQDRLKK